MIALITGASSGIGRDMARELAKRGYDLALVARNEEGLTNLKTELEKEYEDIHITTHAFDLSFQENCEELHKQVPEVDILINNAGFGLFGEFTETDLHKEMNMVGTNVTAVHMLTKLYLQDMVNKDKGHILNVASIAGFMPGPLMATYYASKNYVVALTRAIRQELKKDGSHVKLSLLCPGPVNTNFNNVADVQFSLRGLSSEYVAKYAIEKMLSGKFMIVPGTMVKIGRALSEVIPDAITEKFAHKAQTRKQEK